MSVCVRCNAELPNEGEVALVGGQAFCPSCYRFVTHYPLPLWVKAFAAALVLLVGAGLAYDSRFYGALFAMKRAASMLAAGKPDLALAQSDRAKALVPESADLSLLNEYFRGIDLFSKNDEAGALPLLRDYLSKSPDDPMVKGMVLGIQIGQDFDGHDYASMRDRSKELWELDTSNAIYTLQYASALACVYASSDDQAAKAEALQLIAQVQAGETDQNRAQVDEYVGRIQYRIAKRKIISSEEYAKLSEKERQ